MPRQLLVLNPSTSEPMTHRVVLEVGRLVAHGWHVQGVTAVIGSDAITDPASFEAGARAAVATLRMQGAEADAVLLACFGDPGLAEMRAASAIPVAGMAESAMREAHALARPFRIITTGREWPAMLRESAAGWGLGQWLEAIVALDHDGLAATRDAAAFTALLQQALDAAMVDRIETVILGGVGFAVLREDLWFDGELIDGLGAAVRSLGAGPPAPL